MQFSEDDVAEPRPVRFSVHVTPIYDHKRATTTADTTAVSMPAGRREFALAWWKSCPNRCNAHIPATKRPCNRYCDRVRRCVGLLSKQIISTGSPQQQQHATKKNHGTAAGRVPRLIVDVACKYGDLVHLQEIPLASSLTKLHQDRQYNLTLGEAAQKPWMEFRVDVKIRDVIASRKRKKFATTEDSAFVRTPPRIVPSCEPKGTHDCTDSALPPKQPNSYHVWNLDDTSEFEENLASQLSDNSHETQSPTVEHQEASSRTITPGHCAKTTTVQEVSCDNDLSSTCQQGLFSLPTNSTATKRKTVATVPQQNDRNGMTQKQHGADVVSHTVLDGDAAHHLHGSQKLATDCRRLLFDRSSRNATPRTSNSTSSLELSMDCQRDDQPHTASHHTTVHRTDGIEKQQQSLSMLSMPMGESSLSESYGSNSQEECQTMSMMCEATQWEELKTTKPAAQQQPASNTRLAKDTTLADWHELKKTSHRRSGPGMFRQAMIDLVLLNNTRNGSSNEETKTTDDVTSEAMWLPPLLDGNTKISFDEGERKLVM